MSDIASFIVGLFQDLKSPSRKWVAVILTIAFLGLCVVQYERMTGHFYTSKLEKKVELLVNLQNLADAEVKNDPDLASIYDSLVDEVASFETSNQFKSDFLLKLRNPRNIGKAISGSLFWVVLLIYGVYSEVQKNEGKLNGMTIALAIVLFFFVVLSAWIGIIIPDLWNPWINCLLYVSVQFGLLLFFAKKSSK